MRKRFNARLSVVFLCFFLINCESSSNQEESQSVARLWNEMLLESIRNDFARPTVHARNLFQFSSATYDAWAYLSGKGDTFLLGKSLGNYHCDFNPDAFQNSSSRSRYQRFADTSSMQIREAISYANFRLINHRFRFSPGYFTIIDEAETLMEELGYDVDYEDTDYREGAAALGNYIAGCYIAFGLQDGANEVNGYANQFYSPVNTFPIKPEEPGNPDIVDINRWQPIELSNAIDQAGNPVASAPPFLGPEWGQVYPFSLKQEQRKTYQRDGFDYQVYFDPGEPPKMTDGLDESSENFKWTFALVAIWSSHLSSEDNTVIDISPAGLGNLKLPEIPRDFSKHNTFYDLFEGGEKFPTGYELNPVTGQAYEPQLVKRGDYARVLAEFWADGPDSETPPGHWFTILNYVNDHPQLKRRFAGEGPELGKLEWDVKSYFILGGAMHDVAVAVWGIKGWYDYVRPVSAIRAMAENYANGEPEKGLPLYLDYIEEVQSGDPLGNEQVGKLKIKAWRGPDYINDPETDEAGVGWILAENWWPYQRPTFVSPPFAGYVSGHSTYSRAAAEVLTAITGSSYFPGGLGEFPAPKNEFLVFEQGPSEDVTLQWATYQDASDQCSLSRIWGGIHPPVDDIPGRFIGEKIGQQAFSYANQYFY